MFKILMIMKICLILSSIMMMMASMISKKTFMDREKNSPFECGFDPKNKSRLPFSLHFFLIAVIFLIFDVEITLLFPMIPIIKLSSPMYWIFTSLFFIMILVLGIYHEWNQGALKWTT